MRFLSLFLALLLASPVFGQLRGRTSGLPSRVFNVSDYGATPNDATSDSSAIQTALSAANTAGGGAVWVTVPGTYVLTETDAATFTCLTIYSNTGLYGVPGVIFQRQAGVGKYMIRNADPTLGNDNIVIEGIEWDANSAWVAREGTYTTSTRTLVFDNCATRSATIPYWTFSAANQDICEFMALTGAGTIVANDRCLIESATYDPATAGGRLTMVLAASTGTTSWTTGGVTWETAGDTNLTSVKVRIRRTHGSNNATTGWVRCSLLFVNCRDLRIRDNIFRNEFKYSSWVSGGSNILEENNTFYTASDGHHHEGPLDRVTVLNLRGVCEDNMVAFSSDEGDFFVPVDGPFTVGSISNVLVDGLHVMGGLTPFSIFGNPEYTARNITVRNISGHISEGNALSIKDITANQITGINLFNFLAENVAVNFNYTSATPPPAIIMDMANVNDVTFKEVNCTYSSTAGSTPKPISILYVYGSVVGNWKHITIDGFRQGLRGADLGSYGGVCTIDTSTAGTFPVLDIRNGHLIMALTASPTTPTVLKLGTTCAGDMVVNVSNVLVECDDDTTATGRPIIFNVTAGSGGENSFNLNNFSFISRKSSGGQGTLIQNDCTTASTRSIFSFAGGEIRNCFWFLDGANSANNKTRIVGGGVNLVTPWLTASPMTGDGGSTGEVTVNWKELNWLAEDIYGTPTTDDTFFNNRAWSITSGAESPGIGPLRWNGTYWSTTRRDITQVLTAATTLVNKHSGVTISNVGAAATRIMDLPAATIGQRFTFVRSAAQIINVNPGATDNIALPSTGVIQADGVSLNMDTTGGTLVIECFEAGIWSVVGHTGTFSTGA